MEIPKAFRQLRFNKGTHLFKAGEPATRLYLIQQGLVVLSTQTSISNIEILKASQGQIVGEEALLGTAVYATSVLALNETAAVELTVAQARALFDQSGTELKAVIMGMLTRQAAMLSEVMQLKIEGDATLPCPLEKVTKMFSVVFHVAGYTGKKKDGVTTVNWPGFRKYCQRVFLESPVRLEHAMRVLENVGLANMQMVKCETDPEAPDELGFIHFKNIDEVGAFAKFFRQNFDRSDVDSIKGVAAAHGDLYLDILNELDLWNQNGLPRNTPVPVELESKFPAKKKAA